MINTNSKTYLELVDCFSENEDLNESDVKQRAELQKKMDYLWERYKQENPSLSKEELQRVKGSIALKSVFGI